MDNPNHTARIYDTPEQFPAAEVPLRAKAEFETEGELEIWFRGEQPFFLIDNCQLAEFVMRHFGMRRNDENRSFGRMKVIITPIAE
jgi:hypothetical protein